MYLYSHIEENGYIVFRHQCTAIIMRLSLSLSLSLSPSLPSQLDNQNRGTLTDLGFCKPEAMMTCTIIGTPVYMAPELFAGSYDNAVDIYAFGILFWYIYANDTKFPGAFDACQNKEQLWTAVRKGLRPEKLPRFNTDCWELMTTYWHGDPLQRPLIGEYT